MKPLTFSNPDPARDRVFMADPRDAQWFADVYSRAFPNDHYMMIYDGKRTECEPWGGGRLVNDLSDHIGQLMGMEQGTRDAKMLDLMVDLLAHMTGK